MGWRRGSGLLLALLAVLAGCGGGDSSSTGGSTVAEAPASYAYATFPADADVNAGDGVRFASVGVGTVHAVEDREDGRRAVILLDLGASAFPGDLYASLRISQGQAANLIVLNDRERGVPLDGPKRLGDPARDDAPI